MIRVISIFLALLGGYTATHAAFALPPTIVLRNSTITWENGQQPGIIETNETITCALTLQNSGHSNAFNVVATLSASNGIAPITASQSYGDMPTNGGLVTREFTFTVAGPASRIAQVQLALTANGAGIGGIVFDLPLGETSFTFSRWNTIEVPLDKFATEGPASEYPSVIHVSGLLGSVIGARVTLHNYEHEFSEDLNALLISPAGTNIMLMSDCGGTFAITNVNITFDSRLTNSIPTLGVIHSDTYSATDWNLPNRMVSPAPTNPPYGTYLDQLKRTNPNGDWKLYLYDALYADVGTLHGGWSLTLTVLLPPRFSVKNNGDGRVQLTLSGLGQRSFLIDYSTNLVNWQVLGQVSGASDPAIFYDNLTGQSRRFYRARRLSP